MSVTYGALLRRAAAEVVNATIAALQVADLPRVISEVAAYRELVGALDAHTRQLLHPRAQPTARRPEHVVGYDALATTLSVQLRLAAGRPAALDPTAMASHWHAAAVAIGAAGDLLATHAQPGGHPRSPDIDDVVSLVASRRAAVARLADLTASVLQARDLLEARLLAAGLPPREVPHRLPDTLAAQVLARECARIGRTGENIDSLHELRTARPSVDTGHPLLELADRMIHLRTQAWVLALESRPAVDDLKVFAALGVAVSAHCQARDERLGAGRDGGLGSEQGMPALQAWRAAATLLRPWWSAVPGHLGVQGHTRRVLAILRDVAPLAGTSTTHLPDHEVAQALRAASTITGHVARWCDAALDHLPASHPYGHARDLTGAQVTDDPDLAAAKLAGAKVDMPAVVYGDLRAALLRATEPRDEAVSALSDVSALSQIGAREGSATLAPSRQI